MFRKEEVQPDSVSEPSCSTWVGEKSNLTDGERCKMIFMEELKLIEDRMKKSLQVWEAKAETNGEMEQSTPGFYPKGFGFFLVDDCRRPAELEPGTELGSILEIIQTVHNDKARDRLLSFLDDFRMKQQIISGLPKTRGTLLTEVKNWMQLDDAELKRVESAHITGAMAADDDFRGGVMRVLHRMTKLTKLRNSIYGKASNPWPRASSIDSTRRRSMTHNLGSSSAIADEDPFIAILTLLQEAKDEHHSGDFSTLETKFEELSAAFQPTRDELAEIKENVEGREAEQQELSEKVQIQKNELKRLNAQIKAMDKAIERSFQGENSAEKAASQQPGPQPSKKADVSVQTDPPRPRNLSGKGSSGVLIKAETMSNRNENSASVGEQEEHTLSDSNENSSEAREQEEEKSPDHDTKAEVESTSIIKRGSRQVGDDVHRQTKAILEMKGNLPKVSFELEAETEEYTKKALLKIIQASHKNAAFLMKDLMVMRLFARDDTAQVKHQDDALVKMKQALTQLLDTIAHQHEILPVMDVVGHNLRVNNRIPMNHDCAFCHCQQTTSGFCDVPQTEEDESLTQQAQECKSYTSTLDTVRNTYRKVDVLVQEAQTVAHTILTQAHKGEENMYSEAGKAVTGSSSSISSLWEDALDRDLRKIMLEIQEVPSELPDLLKHASFVFNTVNNLTKEFSASAEHTNTRHEDQIKQSVVFDKLDTMMYEIRNCLDGTLLAVAKARASDDYLSTSKIMKMCVCPDCHCYNNPFQDNTRRTKAEGPDGVKICLSRDLANLRQTLRQLFHEVDREVKVVVSGLSPGTLELAEETFNKLSAALDIVMEDETAKEED